MDGIWSAERGSLPLAFAVLLTGLSLIASYFEYLPPYGLLIGCSAVLVVSTFRLLDGRSHSGTWNGLAGIVVASLTLISIWLPGYQLVEGLRVSRLSLLDVVGVQPEVDVPAANAVAMFAVAAFFLGESLVGYFAASTAASTKSYSSNRASSTVRPQILRVSANEEVWVFCALLTVGILIGLLRPGQSQEAFELRGQVQGQGIQSALSQCLPAAISFGIVRSHWNSKTLGLLSSAGGLFLIFVSQSRSPVLFIVVAVLIRAMMSPNLRARPLKLIAGGIILIYITLTFIVGFSSYRTAILRSGEASFAAEVAEAAANPFGKAASVGALDTADGLALSLRVNPREVEAVPSDPVLGVVNLVPSQLWSDKPEFLGPKVSHEYTVFGGQAGLFLSGPGYFYIIWGGFLGAGLGFALLGAIAAGIALKTTIPTLTLTLYLYFLCRFVIGGDAFDLLYILTMLVGITLVAVPTLVARSLLVEQGNRR